MRVLLHRLMLLAALLVTFSGSATAQQYHFRTYNELDGLLSSTVLDLAQAHDGSLWFATARGLSRYDSTDWTDVGPRGKTPTMSHKFIGRDGRDRMWTVCRDDVWRVFVREAESWREIPPPEEPFVRTPIVACVLGETSAGDTFIAIANTRGYIAVFADERWRLLKVGAGRADLSDMDFVEGLVVVATGQGLFTVDPADWGVRRTTITRPVHAVCEAFDGVGLFVLGDDWIGSGTVGRIKIVADKLPLEFNVPSGGTAALADPSGGLYFGDLGQIHFFHPRYGLELLSRDNGLQSSGVTRFFVDREGNVWVGGLRGVSKLANRSMAGYDSRQGLFDDEVTAVLRRDDGRMVLGHIAGLTLMDNPPRRIGFNQGNKVLERISDLVEGPGHDVWFAADHLGVGHLRDDGSLVFLPDPQMLTQGAYALLFDRQDRLWVGTTRGVCRWDGERFNSVDFSSLPGTGALLVRRLVQARDGSILAATGRFGVVRLRDDEITQYTVPRGDPGLSTYNLLETAAGELLVGTVAGLYLVRDGRLQPATAPWPEIHRPVYSILVDGRGRYWFGTDNGVMRWDGGLLVHLTNRDGLLGTETNRDALKLGGRGDIWIGTDRGLTIYREEFDRAPLAPPLISLTGFEVDGERYGPGEALRLAEPPQNLTVSFRGVTFRDEDHATYLTWLEGSDEQWQGPLPWVGGVARHTHLPAGSYRFHVRVRAADGSLGPVASSPRILIRPSLTSRWWFRVLVVAAVLIMMVTIVTSLASRRYALRLRARVQERTADLERSREQLRAETQRLGATLESISDGVIALDEAGRIVMCNAAVERILGRAESRIKGQYLPAVLDVTPPVLLTSGEPTTHVLKLPNGGQVWCEFSVAPISEPDRGVVGTVLAFRDVTVRREMEDQRVRTQQLESLGVLAGGIAHDFNNLLTIILGNVSLIEDAPGIDQDVREQLGRVTAATESARALTEQFLTFAKGGDPALAPLSLSETVSQVASLAFSGAAVSYELDLAQDLRPVEADRGQISQVLHNLFLNACQAMGDQGTVLIRARNLISRPDDSNWVSLEVHDQGGGIAESDLVHIFDPYFTTKDKGSGLGLAIAFSIVNRHGGRLSVESEVGCGTVFTMVLPAATTAVPGARGEEDRGDLLPAGRILLLDDEEEVLEVYGRLVESLGLTCAFTTDGAETLQVYETARAAGLGFDAVIMDLTIPGGIGGKEAVRKLLAIDPGARVVVASGYSNDPVMANHRAYGFVGALKKPFGKATLRQTLRKVLTGPAPR